MYFLLHDPRIVPIYFSIFTTWNAPSQYTWFIKVVTLAMDSLCTLTNISLISCYFCEFVLHITQCPHPLHIPWEHFVIVYRVERQL